MKSIFRLSILLNILMLFHLPLSSALDRPMVKKVRTTVVLAPRKAVTGRVPARVAARKPVVNYNYNISLVPPPSQPDETVRNEAHDDQIDITDQNSRVEDHLQRLPEELD